MRADLVVVVDHIGLLPLAQDAAGSLYRLVDAAYEKRSSRSPDTPPAERCPRSTYADVITPEASASLARDVHPRANATEPANGEHVPRPHVETISARAECVGQAVDFVTVVIRLAGAMCHPHGLGDVPRAMRIWGAR